MRLRIVATGLCLLATTAQAAGVYKWVDDRGVVHFDDTHLFLPALTQRTLDQRVIQARPGSPTPKPFADQVVEQCRLLEDRLASFRNAREMYGQTPWGDVYRMSPSQMQLTVLETDQARQRYCAPAAADTLYAQRLAELHADPAANRIKTTPVTRR